LRDPCDECYYVYVCDHVLDDNCPEDVKRNFPEIWGENGKLKEID